MTVSSTTTKNSYNGDGSTVAFSYTFRILDEDDIAVILRNNATGNETTQNISANYSVSGVGDAGGGTITFVTAPPTGNTVVLLRATPLTQVTDYTPNDPFPAESHEDALDKLTFITQELSEEVGRSLKLSQTNEIATAEFTAGAAARANKVLGFDSAGDLTVLQEIGIYKGTDTTVTTAAYDPRDLVKSTTAAQLNNVYIALQASPLGTSLTNTTYWALIVDAVSAAASAAAAAVSESNAATSEANAATSESNAATSESNAATSESNASSSASSASTSASNASAAQAAAEAALDAFTDQYLGALASDPSTDLDGDALTDGDLYFNTTDNVMKVYDLGTTTWKQLTPTSAQQANIDTVATDIANVNTVATNLTDINSFAETYFISATAPSSPTEGDLWFDTTNDIMKVYDGSGWVNAGSSVNGTANRYVYTATSGQTTFAATYDAGFIDVFLNGVKLQNGTDFTATDGSNVVLTTGATLNDLIDIVAYGTFSLLSTTLGDISDVNTAGATSGHVLSYNGTNWVSAAAASGDVVDDTTPQLGGNLDTNGNDITFGDNDKAVFGAGSDLQIYHDGGSSWVSDVGAGNLKLTSDGAGVFLQKGATEFMGEFLTDGAVRLYYDNAAKFETTATGVNVTGAISSNKGSAGTLATFSDGVNSNFVIETASLITTVGNTGGSTALAFKSSNTERLRIDSSGSVGVGTSSPSSYGKLVSLGGDNATLFAAVGSTNMLRVQGYNSTYLGTVLEAVNLAQSANTPMFVNASEVKFGINGSERMRIDSSGNVGIGTQTPLGESKLTVANGSLSITGSDQNFAGGGVRGMLDLASGYLRIGTVNGGGSANGVNIITPTGAPGILMNSNGDISMGSSAISSNRLRLCRDNATAYFNAQLELYSDAGNIMQAFHAAGSSVVTLKHVRGVDGIEVRDLNGTTYKDIRASAFTVNSDYRLKENIVPLENATERLKQIPVHRFNFKSIEETGEGFGDATVDGFLAHEVAEHVPEAVFGAKDEMREEDYIISAATGDIYTPAVEATYDEDGTELTAAVDELIHSADVERPIELAEDQYWRETTAEVTGTRTVPKYQSLDQAKLVPLLVKTIQELEARITALEAN